MLYAPVTTPRLNLSARCALTFPLLLAAVSLNRVHAQSTLRRWEIDATIVEFGDPEMIFPDVRLGDPVRGFLSYDLATPPVDDDQTLALYIHDLNFQVVGMTIENPRDGSETEFIADFESPFSFFTAVAVTNDLADEDLGDHDSVDAIQSVASPEGFAGLAPVVYVSLLGPTSVLSDAGLPGELNLDDWPGATIAFVDIFEVLEEPSTFIVAEIHTLTLVVPEPGAALSAAFALMGVAVRARKPRVMTM